MGLTHSKGYELAYVASRKATFNRCRTGAVAIYHGRVLAEGWNCDKTHPLQARYNQLREFNGYLYDSKLHAEMMVISKIAVLDIDFSQVEVYVWRGDKKSLLSRPCAACEAALRELGIKKIFYTGDDSFIKEIYQ